ncbi:nodulation protein NfeD [Oscillochloris sp. ZM17-4]|uniref:NfeD family protein n=1 Tax=Oscillochloris sp. ZM17-4 TaxID=2866714 RepID=UPI001C72B6A6|nr:NfeD family protein [Oscillochloris sp. ZM17-4]MBX0328891.1 nodulation protein NfeD [Oscillochloris sp. ZM17-4]
MGNVAHPRPTWRIVRAAIYLIIALAPLLAAPPARAQADGPIYTVAVDGVISRYTVGYLRRALRDAEAAQATALVIRLGSEGAVLRDVRGLAADVAAAKVPVVVYVAPGGTDAGAAGAWLLSAAHLAAMAPGTSFGVSSPLAEPTGAVSPQVRDLFLAEVTRQLGTWNRDRGRSDAWVDRAAREGAVFTNEQAVGLNPPAIDIVARDEQDLLTSLEGRAVTLEDGSQVVLRTLGRGSRPLEPSLWEQLLLLLSDPTIAFLLLVMAGIAIYAEFATPTVGILAGIGSVLLISSLIGLLALPVNWLSFLGILIAFGLVAADLFVPSHGAMTVVGLVVLIISAFTLFDSAQAPGVAVAFWAIALVSLLIAGFAAIGVYMVVRTRSRPITTGQEGLIGRLAEVRRRLAPEGMVFVDGALWRAVCDNGEAEVGEYVRIVGVYELRLTVHRPDEPQAA